MASVLRFSLLALTVPCLAVGAGGMAEAKCTRLAFSVNDYGKVGPAKDAQAMLDKYIAEWTAKRKIKHYTVGKKDVSCELFLDVGLFDEYTCKASASVCWNEGPAQPRAADAPAPPPVGQAARAKAGEAAPKAPAAAAAPPVPPVPKRAMPPAGKAPPPTGAAPKPQ
ncbi:MAG: hypothetical protein ACREC6_07220 [Hyphomicrobiaceae bacterium]